MVTHSRHNGHKGRKGRARRNRTARRPAKKEFVRSRNNGQRCPSYPSIRSLETKTLEPRLPKPAKRSGVAPSTRFGRIVPIEVRPVHRRLKARVCIPLAIDPTRPPLVALHGISRDPDAIITGFSEIAEQAGRILVVPRFSKVHWPTFQRFGRFRPDKALLQIIDMATVLGLIPAGRFDHFVYSGGAKLAHRFGMLYPNKITTLHMAAAGWCCLPLAVVRSPAGLAANLREVADGKSPIDLLKHAQLGSFLRLPLRLYVGSDNVGRDRALRACSLVAGTQGANRVDRAKTFFASFVQAVKTCVVEPDASFALLPVWHLTGRQDRPHPQGNRDHVGQYSTWTHVLVHARPTICRHSFAKQNIKSANSIKSSLYTRKRVNLKLYN